VHQLELITDLLGTPSSEVIAKVCFLLPNVVYNIIRKLLTSTYLGRIVGRIFDLILT